MTSPCTCPACTKTRETVVMSLEALGLSRLDACILSVLVESQLTARVDELKQLVSRGLLEGDPETLLTGLGLAFASWLCPENTDFRIVTVDPTTQTESKDERDELKE